MLTASSCKVFIDGEPHVRLNITLPLNSQDYDVKDFLDIISMKNDEDDEIDDE